MPPPSADISPKIRGIADQIAQLNLLEVSELCSVLKVCSCASRIEGYWIAGVRTHAPKDPRASHPPPTPAVLVLRTLRLNYRDTCDTRLSDQRTACSYPVPIHRRLSLTFQTRLPWALPRRWWQQGQRHLQTLE